MKDEAAFGDAKRRMSSHTRSLVPLSVAVGLLFGANAVLAGERVTNGGFTSNMSGWSNWTERGSFTVSSQGSNCPSGGSGNCAFVNGDTNLNGGIWQQLSLVSGQNYNITAYSRDVGINANAGWAEVHISTGAPSNGSDYTAGQLVKWDTFGCNNWNGGIATACVQSSTSFTASASTMYIVLKQGQCCGSQADVTWDSISVNGPDPVVNNAPTAGTNATMSSTCIKADDSTIYTVTVNATDTNGHGDIGGPNYGILCLMSQATGGPWTNARGYFAWHPTMNPPTTAGHTAETGACAGGGFVGKFAGGFGQEFVTLIPGSCSTTTSGANQRFVTFAFRAKTNYGALTNMDIGTYVQDSAGAASGWQNTNINFQSATSPSISVQPSNASVTVGDPTNFSVTASGSGLTYQWRKNGVNISNGATGNGSTYSGVTTNSMTITNTQAADSASAANGFDCVVTGTCSFSITSNRASLTATAGNASPTIVSQSVSSNTMLADDTTQYTVTLVVQDNDGTSDIDDMRAIFHNGTFSEPNGRGYLLWGENDADLNHFGEPITIVGNATGGGRWGYNNAQFGATTYITPVSCLTSTNANQRTVTWTFTVKSAYAPSYNQKASGWARDGADATVGWTQSAANFDVVCGSNQLVNGDFSSGSAGWSNWVERGSATFSYTTTGGNCPTGGTGNCARISQPGNFNGGIYRTVQLVGGASYTVEALSKDVNSTASAAWGEIHVGATAPVNGSDYAIGETTKWDTFSCDNWDGNQSTACITNTNAFTATAGTKVTMYVVLKQGQAGGGQAVDVSWDDVKICGPNPAPTVSAVNVVTGTDGSGGTIDVTFDEPMGTGVTTAANYAISGAGKGSFTTNPNSVALQSGNTYRLTWTTGEMVDGATVTITVSNVQDSGGETIGTPNSGNDTGIGVPPTVVSVNRQTPAGQTTNAASVTWRATFSEAIDATTVSAADFTLVDVSSTITGESITGVTPSSGTSTTFDITVNTGTGDGTLRLDVLAAATIEDVAGNDYAATFNTGQTYIIDKTAPDVTSVNRLTPTGQNTNAASVTWRVTFSGDIDATTVSAADFTLTDGGSGITGESVTGVTPTSGTATVFDVTANTGTGDGVLRLDVLPAATISDPIGNDYNQTFNTGQTYIIDRTGPTVTAVLRQTPATQTINNASVTWRVSFNEDINASTVQDADFTVTVVSGSITGESVTGVAQVNSTTWDVTASTGSGDGTLRLDVLPAATIEDPIGNDYNSTYNTGQTYIIDKTPPQVTAVIRQVPTTQTINLSAVTWRVFFNEAPSAATVQDADFTLTDVSSTITGESITGVAQVNATTWDVSANTGTGSGTLRLDVLPAATITDSLGNDYNTTFNTGQTYIIDKTGPTVTINQATSQDDPSNNASILFTIVFNESVLGFATGDVNTSASTTPGALTGNVFEIAPFNNTTFQVSVSGMTGSGNVIVSIDAAVATDVAGNASSASTSTDNVVEYDVILPAATSLVRLSPTNQYTTATTLSWRITFNEPMDATTASAADFTLVDVGSTITGETITGVTPTTGLTNTFDITVNTGTGDGTLRLDHLWVISNITDEAGNEVDTNINGETFIVDRTAPQIQTRNPVSGASVPDPFTSLQVTFNELMDVGTIQATDLTVNGAPASGISGSGAGPYTFTFSNPANGTVNIVLGTAIADLAGNSFAGRSWTYEKGLAPQILSWSSVRTHGSQGPVGIAVKNDGTFSTDARTGTIYDIRIVLNEQVEVSGGPLSTAITFETSPNGSTGWSAKTPNSIVLANGDTEIHITLATSGGNAAANTDYCRFTIGNNRLISVGTGLAIEGNDPVATVGKIRNFNSDTTESGLVTSADVMAIRTAILLDNPFDASVANLDVNLNGLLDTLDMAIVNFASGN